jgi:hypothetical protein
MMRGVDVWGFDYHIFNRGKSLADGIAVWERVVDAGRSFAGRAKPFWVSIETGQHLPTGRGPTATEFRQLVENAVRLGASGIVYFPIREPKYGFSWDVTTPEVDEEMKRLAAEFDAAAAPPPVEYVEVPGAGGSSWRYEPAAIRVGAGSDPLSLPGRGTG